MIFSGQSTTVFFSACALVEFAILGQTGATIENIAPWGAGLINLGFVGWLAWYTQTRTIPRLVDDFRMDLKQLTERFINENALSRDRFSVELKAERDHCNEHRMKMLDMVIKRRVEQEVKRAEGA